MRDVLIRGLILVGCACASAPVARTSQRSGDVAPLFLSEAEVSQLDSRLLADLQRDPHHYFRYLAHAFVGQECEVSARGPVVNLHGDAHLEQYLVTTLGRGLGDFDDATVGPADIDLVRLATSIRIAGRMRSWNANELWRRFLEGYVRALGDPSTVAPAPAYSIGVQSQFHQDHARMLNWCETLFRPTGVQEQERVSSAFARHVEALLLQRPELERAAFGTVRVGRHQLGVGSRRQTNYLIRTQGLSDSPDDDLMFEAKAVVRNQDATCLPTAGVPDPLRILVADARIAYAPFRDVGVAQIDGRPYWIHEFVDDYVELSLEDPQLSEALILEVVYDMGVQLGLGHPRNISEPYDDELRSQLLAFVEAERAGMWVVSGRLFDGVWAGWRTL